MQPQGFDLGSLAALLAALVVVLAVLLAWQASRREAERQRQIDRELAALEQGRKKMALARALLFEVDGFYRHYLSEVAEALAASNSPEGSYPIVRWPSTQPFPVYTANAGRIGEFDEETLEELIGYYAAAAAYVASLRDYRLALDRLLRKETAETAILEARLHLSRIREALPELVDYTGSLCRKLSEMAGVPYQYLRVAKVVEPARRPTAAQETPAEREPTLPTRRETIGTTRFPFSGKSVH
ncbi:MAG: hypothetical protein K6U02_06760 [Firmicutes bacterium]|nr:hypothetical protein [Bacillota bacterium]